MRGIVEGDLKLPMRVELRRLRIFTQSRIEAPKPSARPGVREKMRRSKALENGRKRLQTSANERK